MRSEREREEDHDSFTPCQKHSPPPIPKKSEFFLCRAETVTAEAILNEKDLPALNKLHWIFFFFPFRSNRSRRGNNSWSVRCLSASLPVICSTQVVKHTAENREHTLAHFSGVNNKTDINRGAFLLKRQPQEDQWP